MPPSSELKIPPSSDLKMPFRTDLKMPSRSDLIIPSCSDLKTSSSSDLKMPSRSDLIIPSCSDLKTSSSSDQKIPLSSDLMTPSGADQKMPPGPALKVPTSSAIEWLPTCDPSKDVPTSSDQSRPVPHCSALDKLPASSAPCNSPNGSDLGRMPPAAILCGLPNSSDQFLFRHGEINSPIFGVSGHGKLERSVSSYHCPSPLTYDGPRSPPTSPLTTVGRAFDGCPTGQPFSDDIATQCIAQDRNPLISDSTRNSALPQGRVNVCIRYIYFHTKISCICSGCCAFPIELIFFLEYGLACNVYVRYTHLFQAE